MKRYLSTLLSVAGLAAVAWAAWRFPWSETAASLSSVRVGWLLLAAAANFVSLEAKGASWHLLLKRRAPVRLATASAATLVGAAIGSIGLSVAGDAARVRYVMTRARIPLTAIVTATVAARLLEAVALLAVVAGGAGLLHRLTWMPEIRIGSAGLLALIVLLAWRPALGVATAMLPERARTSAERWQRLIVTPSTFSALALCMANWLAQLAAYWMACRAVALPAASALALAAMILANIGGIFRLTPGNIGVLQASFALAAVPLGLPTEAAVAASLVLQAVQVLPVLLAGAGIMVYGAVARSRRIAALPA